MGGKNFTRLQLKKKLKSRKESGYVVRLNIPSFLFKNEHFSIYYFLYQNMLKSVDQLVSMKNILFRKSERGCGMISTGSVPRETCPLRGSEYSWSALGPFRYKYSELQRQGHLGTFKVVKISQFHGGKCHWVSSV